MRDLMESLRFGLAKAMIGGCDKMFIRTEVMAILIERLDTDKKKIEDLRHALELSRIALLNQKPRL